MMIHPKNLFVCARGRGSGSQSKDDREEQGLLNDCFNNRLVDTDKFDAQKELVDEVVGALKIGEDEHWSTIQAALKIPASPN
jgi:hypothetical protein